MIVKLGLGERFINYVTHHAPLWYIRGESRCKDFKTSQDLHLKALRQVVPFLERIYQEGFEEGRKADYDKQTIK